MHKSVIIMSATTTTRIQTAFRLRPELLERIKYHAAREKKSVNSYVEEILERETRPVIPKFPPNFEVSEEIKAMNQCLQLPSKEEIEADPKLAHILAYETESIY